jgi:protein-tyrosine phosphatase
MSVLSGDRHIVCDGAFNLRDLGGYTTADGRTVRWQTLYRADGLHRIPPGAAQAVAPLGWRTILDLRTKGEHDEGAFRHHEGADVVHLPVIRAPWDVTGVDDADPVDFLASRYMDMLDEGVDALTTAVGLLATEARLPAVFHCSAGKDRTGVIAALLLATAGVPDDDIADDYTTSSVAMAKLVEWVQARSPEAADAMAKQPAAFLSCPPEAMHVFLARIRAQWGSVAGYLRGIGVEDDTLDAVRAAFLGEG